MEEMMGVIKLFAGNFAPKNFMYCNGALLSIAQNSALFSILGTTYGGDGISTFALPNLNGRYPIGAGNASTGSYTLGEMAGSPETTLLTTNLPSISSQLKVANANANSAAPSSSASIAITGNTVGRDFTAVPSYVNGDPDTVINPKSVFFQGQNLPVNNMPPYLGLNYIICVAGIFPSRP
ncbi:microcystin-dependent protein [Chryseobacterium ginsenosidimutans]|jgi:microcystin-dependent protein|uniref:phage tail protein n=1 Tax=Chryseobacterium ginsenosidimutans TaxID=687846 RepID=UPI002167DCB1|nr:tail fiber protein [Chryseobacterium ginsenosidimutans]MCS3868122.1 microcystin-dependent protein [Chryseobacterium ginsenosidimutans]